MRNLHTPFKINPVQIPRRLFILQLWAQEDASVANPDTATVTEEGRVTIDVLGQ